MGEFTLSRREALTLLACAAAVQNVVPGAAYAAPAAGSIREVPSLGAIGQENGILFGSAFDADVLTKPDVAEIYAHQSRVLTSNNFLKFGELRGAEGDANFELADQLVSFATDRAIAMRGHCLIWNEWTPEWLRQQSPDRVGYWLDRHIDEVAGRYAGRMHSWDVVNEPFWPQHNNAGGYRGGPWYAALGKDYVLRALRRAHAADPAAKLVINELGPEWKDAWGDTAAYRIGLLRIIDEAQDQGVRIDAIGLQCHWMPEFRFDPGLFEAFLNDIAARGLAIYLTELDVSDARIIGSTGKRDAAVATRYRLLVSTALKQPKVEVIQTWELTDNASWLRGDSRHFGPNGRLPRPLPFDDQFRPKAAYHAIAAAMRNRKRAT